MREPNNHLPRCWSTFSALRQQREAEGKWLQMPRVDCDENYASRQGRAVFKDLHQNMYYTSVEKERIVKLPLSQYSAAAKMREESKMQFFSYWQERATIELDAYHDARVMGFHVPDVCTKALATDHVEGGRLPGYRYDIASVRYFMGATEINGTGIDVVLDAGTADFVARADILEEAACQALVLGTVLQHEDAGNPANSKVDIVQGQVVIGHYDFEDVAQDPVNGGIYKRLKKLYDCNGNDINLSSVPERYAALDTLLRTDQIIPDKRKEIYLERIAQGLDDFHYKYC